MITCQSKTILNVQKINQNPKIISHFYLLSFRSSFLPTSFFLLTFFSLSLLLTSFSLTHTLDSSTSSLSSYFFFLFFSRAHNTFSSSDFSFSICLTSSYLQLFLWYLCFRHSFQMNEMRRYEDIIFLPRSKDVVSLFSFVFSPFSSK